MTLTRAMRALGATTLTGALLLTAAPTASADQVRDAQWANQYFNLDKVWSVSKGDGVIVAVIDSGVDGTHPDLAGQVLPGFDPGGQGREKKNSTDPHGTGLASVIAGRGHGDGEGVVGLAPGAKILPIYKSTATDGDAIPDGIKWAVDHGAKVINISQGGDSVNPKMAGAIAYAYQHDVLIVASAGNSAAPVEEPGRDPGILAVGAVDKGLKVWSKSNFGPELLLTAPGVDLVMAGDCGSSAYCKDGGTSYATAYVSAAAALVRAKYPKLTAGQVANRLAKSASVPASLSGAKLPDTHYGYGIIRPYEALTQNIPAGSELGPLAKPDGVSAPSATATAGTGSGTSANPGTGAQPAPGAELDIRESSNMPLILGGVAVGLVVLALVIGIAVSSSRRRNRSQAAQGQAGTAPGWPPAQQQPYGQQPPAYGQQQPPPPYGQQAPPPGYPPQQPPYQNPYQDGNQSR